MNQNGRERTKGGLEREFLEKTHQAVSLDAWGRIVQRAVRDAEIGDSRARDWLARHFLPSGKEKEESNRVSEIAAALKALHDLDDSKDERARV